MACSQYVKEPNSGISPNRTADFEVSDETKSNTKTLVRSASVVGPLDLSDLPEGTLRPLDVAAKYDDCERIKILIDAGEDVNATSTLDLRPLHFATHEGKSKAIQPLIHRGADVDVLREGGESPLHFASRGGKYDAMDILIQAGANINIKDISDKTPLHAAVTEGKCEAVDNLCKAGANVNISDGKGKTPIYHAASMGKCVIIDHLVKFGADVNLRDHVGNTPIHAATESKEGEAIDHLIKGNLSSRNNICDQTPLLTAVKASRYRAMVRLLNNNTDVNIGDNDGKTPLHVAAREGKCMFVNHLIESNADINARDVNGSTPLHLAVSLGATKTVKLLVEKEADVKIENKAGLKAVHLASLAGNTDSELVQFLLQSRTKLDTGNPQEVSLMHRILIESSLDVLNSVAGTILPLKAEGKFRRTLLHLVACLGISEHMVSLLSNHGDDIAIDCKDDTGRTPVHYATEIGDETLVKQLIDKGCKLDALNNDNMTVLHLAAIHGHCKLVEEFICNYKLDPCVMDICGRNCLHLAVLYRREDAVKSILNSVSDSNLLNVEDKAGRRPADYIYDCEGNSMIGRYLRGEVMFMRIKEYALGGEVPLLLDIKPCPNLSKVSSQPFLGSVKYFEPINTENLKEKVEFQIKHVIELAITEKVKGDELDKIEIMGCGSSFEGTKNCLPDEFDFIVKLFTDETFLTMEDTIDQEGYVKMKRPVSPKLVRLNVIGSCGIWFWDMLMQYWNDCQISGDTELKGDGYKFEMTLPPQRHPDHKTCATWIWLYSDLTGSGSYLVKHAVSIDLVPAIKRVIGPKKTRSTWKMTWEEVCKESCFLVPKIPHGSGSVQGDDLNQLGRISYHNLELDHIKDLEERIKNVYITAKCLRNVEVCLLKVKNRKDDVELIKKYITSYILKTVFLHLVEFFNESNLSLGRMVLKVYEQLEECMKMGKLPMFFSPDVDVMVGSRLSTTDCRYCCGIMTRLVKQLYERDYDEETRKKDTIEMKDVLERQKEKHCNFQVLHNKAKVRYDKAWADYNKDISEGCKNTKIPEVEVPVLPLYLWDIVS